MIRPVLFCLTLAACAAPAYGPGCACVFLPEPNGGMAIGVDGRTYTRGDVDRFPIDGWLLAQSQPDSPVSRFEVSVSGTLGPLHFIGAFPDTAPGAAFDESARARLIEANFDPEPSAPDAERRHYDLGPRGGTVRITEIVPGEAAPLRVRGEMRAQMCDEIESSSCVDLIARFAFDARERPVAFELLPVIVPE